ncbi:MAG: hypothetical protein R3F61_04060 [Myxococcota bacterium]
MRILVPAVLAVVALSACTPLTEENAPERVAETVCRKTRTCDSDAWDDLYDNDFEECVDAQTDVYEFVLEVGGVFGLDLDLEEVGNCMRDIRRSSCDEWLAGDIGPNCNDVLSF